MSSDGGTKSGRDEFGFYSKQEDKIKETEEEFKIMPIIPLEEKKPIEELKKPVIEAAPIEIQKDATPDFQKKMREAFKNRKKTQQQKERFI